MPGGRPTKYREEYCQKLIDHMAGGFSYESFGAVIDCAEQTYRNWEEKHPEFLEAKKVAFDKSRLFWEKIGMDLAQGKLPGGNSTAWIFNMKNRFTWKDRVDHTTKDESIAPLTWIKT